MSDQASKAGSPVDEGAPRPGPAPNRPKELQVESEDPPVVARMVVEIRSDGLRTVARGAIEDAATGQRVAIKADGSTPLALATALAKSLLAAPALATRMVGSRLLVGRGGSSLLGRLVQKRDRRR